MPILKNARHEAFARAIVEGKSARDAYQAAGYKSKGRGADANASRLISNDNVARRVAELKEEAAKGAVMTGREVLEELSKLGRANMADYTRVGLDGDPVLNFAALTRDQAAALVEVTVEDFLDSRGEDARQVRRVKFKLADKRGALDLLGKYHKLFAERREHSGLDGGPIEVEVKRYTDIEAARWIGRLLKKVDDARRAKDGAAAADASPAQTDPAKTDPAKTDDTGPVPGAP
jgi:phage terminase small subunit